MFRVSILRAACAALLAAALVLPAFVEAFERGPSGSAECRCSNHACCPAKRSAAESRQPRLPAGARRPGLRAVASGADAGIARRVRLSSGGRPRRSRATQGCPVLCRPDRPRAPPGNGPSPLPAADTPFQPGLRARPSAASPHPALRLNEGRDEIPPSVSAALGAPSPPRGTPTRGRELAGSAKVRKGSTHAPQTVRERSRARCRPLSGGRPGGRPRVERPRRRPRRRSGSARPRRALLPAGSSGATPGRRRVRSRALRPSGRPRLSSGRPSTGWWSAGDHARPSP